MVRVDLFCVGNARLSAVLGSYNIISLCIREWVTPPVITWLALYSGALNSWPKSLIGVHYWWACLCFCAIYWLRVKGLSWQLATDINLPYSGWDDSARDIFWQCCERSLVFHLLNQHLQSDWMSKVMRWTRIDTNKRPIGLVENATILIKSEHYRAQMQSLWPNSSIPTKLPIHAEPFACVLPISL